MRSGILRTYVATLRLNRWAPFPSQIKARQAYRMRARPVGPVRPATIPKTVKYFD